MNYARHPQGDNYIWTTSFSYLILQIDGSSSKKETINIPSNGTNKGKCPKHEKAKDIFAAHYQLHLQYKYITRSGVCGNIHREL